MAMDGSMRGRVCVVTGASSGVGRATAIGLAGLGAMVVLVCRDPERGEAAREDVAKAGATSGGQARLEVADLAVQRDVRELAKRLHQRLDRLDVLVNNAGGIFGRRRESHDGIELTLALNHLAYFLLTNLVVDMLRASAPSRVVNVASAAHSGARLNLDDLQLRRGYRPQRAYANSKLDNVLFTYELARRLAGTGVSVNCVHPGTVRSGFGRDGSALFRLGVRLVQPFMITPEAGADTVIYLATSPEVEGVTGKYFVKRQPRPSSAASYEETTANRLWEESARLTRLRR
jgi:NAD(P)-dependent dehydrogenase (short-subunit alcohol dehydrogenase family)